MDDVKDLLEILPEEPEKKLRDWAFLQNGDLLGGELCLFRRGSVELYPEDQGWPFHAPERTQNKRVWGARCTCTACGEDFIAGYGSAKQGGMQIKGIRLLCGDDGQLWPGIPEQEDGVWDRSAAEIAEGEALSCPYCGAEVRLIHAGSLRGGRTWQLLLCQAAALEAQEDAAKVGAAQRSRAEVAEAKAKELEDKLDKAKTKYKLARQELRQLQENPTIPQDAMDKLRREAEEQAAKEAAEKAEARQAELRAARDKANEDAYNAREVARQAEKDRDEARRRLALANPDAAVFAALYGQVQEDWNKLHGAWIKAAAADAATGEKLRTAARALAEKWRKEEW